MNVPIIAKKSGRLTFQEKYLRRTSTKVHFWENEDNAKCNGFEVDKQLHKNSLKQMKYFSPSPESPVQTYLMKSN